MNPKVTGQRYLMALRYFGVSEASPPSGFSDALGWTKRKSEATRYSSKWIL